MSCNVAFIGLGVMGYPMAGYISKAGHNVTVYNRTAAKADKWITEYKGSKADTPAKAAEGADFIFTCVGNDNDLREVSLGENGLFNTAKEGCVYIDNSTVSAEISRELYKAAKDKSFDFLDAPISGGQAGAEGGILTVMVGGDEDVFNKAQPVIDCYSRKVKLIGATGSGQLTKMMNQMCIAGAVQGLSEAINFGINAGLDMDKVMETISKGAAQSWQMENRYRTMTDDKFDYGFAVDWMRKDLAIVIEEAKKNDSFELRKALRNHDIDTLVLSSRGGSVWEGLSMAGIIHDKGLTTYVPKLGLEGRGDCASACSFMFFAGKTREAEGDVGVHQFYSGSASDSAKVEETEEIAQFTVSEIIGFLNEFETPPFVFERMFQQSKMYYFDYSSYELSLIHI